jgi:hypothetical protein
MEDPSLEMRILTNQAQGQKSLQDFTVEDRFRKRKCDIRRWGKQGEMRVHRRSEVDGL